jgi:CRISPR-associated protein Cmr6
MSPKQNKKNSKLQGDLWQSFVNEQKKNGSKLYHLIKSVRCFHQNVHGNSVSLSLQVDTQEQHDQIDKRDLSNKFQKFHKLLTVTIDLTVDKTENLPKQVATESFKRSISNAQQTPLQALNHTLLQFDATAKSASFEAMQQAIAADRQQARTYTKLTDRTKALASVYCEVEFPWRLQVGGQRGFDERLFPAFHPVYGIPYVTSSSIRGAVRAWVKRTKGDHEASRLFGTLDDGAGYIQFFDAYPTEPCLSLDTATPLWKWDSRDDVPCVKYSPEPHGMLSLLRPTLIIGIQATMRGASIDVDLKKVCEWIPQALSEGLGSRVSAGYGRAKTMENNRSNTQSYEFSLRTAGIYGAVPDRKAAKVEFRPTAVRGVLRYWFRAVAFAMYAPASVRKLEAELFGAIEPTTKVGALQVSVGLTEESVSQSKSKPHYFEGEICLSTTDEASLHLAGLLLELGSNLGGLGKGARRPLHWNEPHPGLRGCHWELDDYIWGYDSDLWSEKLNDLRDSMRRWVQSRVCRWSELEEDTTIERVRGNADPGNVQNRYQDVLNHQTRLLLLPCRQLELPDQVSDWRMEGLKDDVRGEALALMYGNLNFKGVNPHTGQGSPEVGGRDSVPSFATISSNFPFGDRGDPTEVSYQVVVIFGAKGHGKRTEFAKALIGGGAIEIPLQLASSP